MVRESEFPSLSDVTQLRRSDYVDHRDGIFEKYYLLYVYVSVLWAYQISWITNQIMFFLFHTGFVIRSFESIDVIGLNLRFANVL